MKQDLSNANHPLESALLNQDKWEMLLGLLEHPENYSESLKDELLADAEIKAIYQQMVETREAFGYQRSKEEMKIPSVSEEWERFRSEERKIKSKKAKSISLWSPVRKVAAVAAVLVVSGIAFAAIHLATHRHQKETAANQEVVAERKDSTQQAITIASVASSEKADSVSSEKLPLVYENAELQAILTPIAQHFHLKVVYQNEASRHIRLYLQLAEGMGLDDIIELMNHFEKVNVRSEGENLIVE